jgi:hypothetical protein
MSPAQFDQFGGPQALPVGHKNHGCVGVAVAGWHRPYQKLSVPESQKRRCRRLARTNAWIFVVEVS